MYRHEDQGQSFGDPIARSACSLGDTTSLFGVCIERIGGFSVTATGTPRFPSGPAVDSLAEETKSERRALACAMLERRIRGLFDNGEDESARALIALKRDVFNARASAERVAAASASLEEHDYNLLQEALQPDLLTTPEAAREPMPAEVADAAVFRSAALRAALSFTDRQRVRLLRETRDDGRPVKPGELRRSRLALLQFVARARFKTTPFSYLGSTRIHRYAVDATGNPTPKARSAAVTLDSALARRLVWTILLATPALRRGLEIALNPSFRINDDGCMWSATRIEVATTAEWAAAPVELRAPQTALLQSLSCTLGNKRTMPLGGLEAAGASGAVSVGLLVNGLVIATDLPGAQDPVVSWLLDRVEQGGAALQPLVHPLRVLAENERSAPIPLDPARAIDRLGAVRTAVATLYREVGVEPPGEKRPPLYHAVALAPMRHDTGAGPLASKVAPHLEAIDAILRLTRFSSRTFAVQTATADAFLQAYGVDGRANGLAFFQAFGDLSAGATNDGGSALDRFLSRAGSVAADGTVTIRSSEVRDFVAAMPDHLDRRAVSLGLQVQATTRRGNASLVVNRILPGGLRLHARHLGEEDLSSGVVADYLARIEPHARPVALPATAGISGALHPQLVAEEMMLPGVERDRRAARPIDLADTIAVLDRATHRVVLIDRAGQRIAPMVFGAVNPELIAPLARRLSENGAASPPPLYATMLRARDVAAARAERRALVMIPEVSIDRVIVTRETMIYAVEDFPAVEDERGFSAAMRRFLTERGLPTQLFIRFPDGALLPRLSRKLDSARQAAAMRPHVRIKPAYFDFDRDDYAMLFRHGLASGMPLVSVQACTPHPREADGYVRELQFEALLEGGR